MPIMTAHKTNFAQTKTLALLTITILFASCSTGTEIINNLTHSASSSSPQTANLPARVAIPGVNNVEEINFKATSKNSFGVFGVINGSRAQKIDLPRATPVIASGWAILTDEGRPAERVIITYGNNNSLLAVSPVNLPRPDVVKALKNPKYVNSGWSATFNSSTLPAEPVVLKAWAYNAETKEAAQLNSTHQVVVVD